MVAFIQEQLHTCLWLCLELQLNSIEVNEAEMHYHLEPADKGGAVSKPGRPLKMYY